MGFSYVLALSLAGAMVLPGCTEEAWPEVSDENCQSHMLWRMKDKERSEEFGSFCSRIPTVVRPIDPDKWFSMSFEEQQKLRESMARSKGSRNQSNGFSRNLERG